MSGPRYNQFINVPKVRVIDENGENLGVMYTREAIEQAAGVGLDLVEISPGADPPVAKFLDIGRFKYEAQKKANEQRKRQKTQEIKEIKMRPNIDDHDYDVKMRKVFEFLEEAVRSASVRGSRGRTRTPYEGQPVPTGSVSVHAGWLRGQRDPISREAAVRRTGRAPEDVRLVSVVHRRVARWCAGRLRRRGGDRARPDVVRHHAEPQPAGGGAGARDPERTTRDRVDRVGAITRQDHRAAPHRRGVRDAGRDERRSARRRSPRRLELRREPQQRDPDGRDP